MAIHRRRFLQSAALAAAATNSLFEGFAAEPATGTAIPRRPLGKTGEMTPIIGVGGADLALPREDRTAYRIMDRAIDAGATFFDNAWSYSGGVAEERMGQVLSEPAKRSKVFLMTKVVARDAAGAQKQLEDSLRRLRTGVIDLWQFHQVGEFAEVEAIFAPGGAMEVAQKARKEGKIRYVGFTGHADPAIHLDMLERYSWDAVMLPINPVDAHWMSFQREVLPKVVEKGCAVIAFKALARGRGLARAYTVSEALRYAWSLPVSVLVSGMDRNEYLDINLEMAMNFQPMPRAEREALLARVKQYAGPLVEYYKKKA
jgi:uncharacterized protein